MLPLGPCPSLHMTYSLQKQASGIHSKPRTSSSYLGLYLSMCGAAAALCRLNQAQPGSTRLSQAQPGPGELLPSKNPESQLVFSGGNKGNHISLGPALVESALMGTEAVWN